MIIVCLGKVIGHAFRPSDGGTHFDDDELWSLSSNLTSGQIHLPSVALHETGHALGLDHVNDFMSVMSAYYSKVKMTPSPVDIGQLNDLYGKCANTTHRKQNCKFHDPWDRISYDRPWPYKSYNEQAIFFSTPESYSEKLKKKFNKQARGQKGEG